jgi:hypothetical protein
MSKYSVESIFINSNSLVNNGYNNTYQYNIPGGGMTFKDAEIAIAKINIFYSWFNINSTLYNNNTFSIIFPTASTTQTLNITLPDGYMSYSDINSYVQSQMITAGLYLKDASGNYIFFWEIQENATLYSAQINQASVPTTIGSYSYASSGTYSTSGGLPATAYTPQTVITSNNFTNLVGLSAGTYPVAQTVSDNSQVSTYTPQISPVQSLSVLCSLVNTKYMNPPNVCFNISNGNVPFGSLISIEPSEYNYLTIPDQSTSNIQFQFLDQNYNIVQIKDPNVLIQINIRTPI